MQRQLQLAAVLLTATLGASTLFAQGHGHKDGGAQVGGGRSAGTSAGTSGGSNTTHHAGTRTSGTGRTLSTQPSPGYVSPFQQQIHLNPPTSGCLYCGGGYYYGGGFGYGYSGSYNPAGPTATDRILANGGTFNNINNSPDTVEQPVSQPPMYVRPESPTNFSSDNGTVNTPIEANVASASSDSPAILIFKDGTDLTIHNYAIYGANIVVLAPERKKFAISSIDVAATQKANEAAGYELKLPAVFTSH